jgi:hypothetical protein
LKIDNVLATDLRSLAAMRIAVALVTLLDLSIRASDLTAHYTNWGVLPLRALFTMSWNEWYISLHTLNGTPLIQALVFTIHACFALALLFGYKTRLSTFLCWLLAISIQARNPMILQDGDALLRLMLFWGIFLPWGNRYSVDSIHQSKRHSDYYFSIASAAIILQVLYVYQFTAFVKDFYEWGQQGTALYYALQLDMIVWPLGKVIREHFELTRWLTYAAFYMEMFILPFCMIPLYNRTIRIIAVFILVSFHIGIIFTIFVGLFPLISISSFIVLTPGDWWGKLAARIKRIGIIRPVLAWCISAIRRRRSFAHTQQNMPALASKYTLRKKVDFVVVSFCLVLVTLWNFTNVRQLNLQLPSSIQTIAILLRLDQGWAMFAPKVFKYDGWFIMEATLANGEVYDISRADLKLNKEKPESIVSMFKNDRWRKYSENILLVHNAPHRGYYSDFMVQRWNKAHLPEEHIVKFRMIYITEETPEWGQPPIPNEEVLLWEYIPAR